MRDKPESACFIIFLIGIVFRPMSLLNRCSRTSSILSTILNARCISNTPGPPPNRVKLTDTNYAPSKQHISLPFSEYMSMKKAIKVRGRVCGVLMYATTAFGSPQLFTTLFPQYAAENPPPVE